MAIGYLLIWDLTLMIYHKGYHEYIGDKGETIPEIVDKYLATAFIKDNTKLLINAITSSY